MYDQAAVIMWIWNTIEQVMTARAVEDKSWLDAGDSSHGN